MENAQSTVSSGTGQQKPRRNPKGPRPAEFIITDIQLLVKRESQAQNNVMNPQKLSQAQVHRGSVSREGRRQPRTWGGWQGGQGWQQKQRTGYS